jgi:hypothetical protein
MVAFPRSSKTLIFVRTRHELADDTVTEILPGSARPKSRTPKVRAHRPPKPRTSAEADLPSIMLADDANDKWGPPVPWKARRVERANEPTVVGLRRPTAAELRLAGRGVSERRYNLTLVFVALGLGLLCMYLAPLLGRAMDAAFVAMNR